MKKSKKILIALLSATCAVSCAFGLAACKDKEETNKPNSDIYAVYESYVAYAEENSQTVLTYEQWLQTIKGETGSKGDAGKSAYDIAVEGGYKGTKEQWLESLKGLNGADGKSAYDIAVEGGYKGTKEEWLESLKGLNGADGKSAYDIAVEGGYKGTKEEWLESLKGEQGGAGVQGESGKSAYQIAVDNGFKGTQAEWLESLKGANGLDGQCTITSLNYINSVNYSDGNIKFDKWGIQHRLKITYLDENSETKTVISEDTLNIVDQNVFYNAANNEDLWALINLNVRRVRLTSDILWSGNKFIQDKNTSKYYSNIELDSDIEIDINGNDIILEADTVDVVGSASITLKNGGIKRINRITTTNEELYGKVLDENTQSDGVITEHKGRSVYVPAKYADGKDVASDAELKRTTEINRDYFNSSKGNRVVTYNVYDANCATIPTIHVNNYCSLKLDTVEYFTFFTGILVDGLSSVIEVVNNSVMDVEGAYGISTNASGSERWNVVVRVEDSTVNASVINGHRETVPQYFPIATALLINVPGSVVVQNSDLIGTTQALVVRGGHAVARNSRISSYGVGGALSRTEFETGKYKDAWGVGNTVPNATVVVGNKSTSYQYSADCTLTNCSVNSNIYHINDGVFNQNWEIVYVNGNGGLNGTGYDKDGVWLGATFTYDAMTFARSGDVDFHIENATAKSANVYRPEMLLNANEWYTADTQRKIRDLMDFGAKNIRLTADVELQANNADGYMYIDRDINIGLNGYTLNIASKGIKITNNADFKLQNGRVIMNGTQAPEAGYVDGNYAIEVGEFASFTLESVKMYANRSGIFMNGKAATLDVLADSEINVGGYYAIGTNANGSTDFGVMVTVRYSKIKANGSVVIDGIDEVNGAQGESKFGVGILFNVPGTLKVEKSSVIEGYTQGVIMRDGIAVIENSSVAVTGSNEQLSKYVGAEHEEWGRGFNVPNAAIVMGTYNTVAAEREHIYRSPVDVTLRNVTIGKAETNSYLVYIHNDGETTEELGATTLTFDKLTKMKSGGGDIYTVCEKQANELEKNKIYIWDETV